MVRTNGMLNSNFLMTRFNSNKYSNSSKVNGNYVAVPLKSDLTPPLISSALDKLIKGKERVVWHKEGVFKERSIQAIAREKGIRFVED